MNAEETVSMAMLEGRSSMARNYFDLNFTKVSNADFAVYLGIIAKSLAIHPHFQNLSEDVPNSEKFSDLELRLGNAIKAAQYKDTQKKAEMDAVRLEGEDNVHALAHYASFRFLVTKDPGILANLGIAPKKPTAKKVDHASVTAPKNVKARHGSFSGWVFLKADWAEGYVTCEVQYCQGDPTREESWSLGEHFPYCSSMEVKGLEPGKIYHFRVRYLGKKGRGPWSSVVSLMVV